MAFTTKKSLLAKVRSGDQVSWQEFYDTYRPLIILCGKDFGLSQDDNDELVQMIMCEIFKKDILTKYNIDEIPKDIFFIYDPKRGRFRHYLKAIIRNHALKLSQRKNRFIPVGINPKVPSESSFDASFDISWDAEWRRHVFTQALTELKLQVQPETFAAFEMYALQNRPVKEVAEFLNTTPSSIYVAKTRCIASMKTIILHLEASEE